MGQLQALQRLVESGNEANIGLVREMVKSPALFKYRGVLRRCGMRVFEQFHQGEGVIGSVVTASWGRSCECQARVKCKICERLVCKPHFVIEIGECTECGGKDRHHVLQWNMTQAQWDRINYFQDDNPHRKVIAGEYLHKYLRDEAGFDGSPSDLSASWGVVFPKRRRSRNYPMTPSEAFPAMVGNMNKNAPKAPVAGEGKPVKYNPRPSRFGFLEGLKTHKSR